MTMFWWGFGTALLLVAVLYGLYNWLIPKFFGVLYHFHLISQLLDFLQHSIPLKGCAIVILSFCVGDDTSYFFLIFHFFIYLSIILTTPLFRNRFLSVTSSGVLSFPVDQSCTNPNSTLPDSIIGWRKSRKNLSLVAS